MDVITVERLDHLGIIAGVIKDLGLIEMIDTRVGLDDQEGITTGEAIAGMILNGLGFSDRAMSLTPQFFANKPVGLLFRDGVSAEHCNRFKLGRSLDKTFSYGCDTLFSEVALAVCQQEEVALTFTCLDTTSFSLTGAYVPETDAQAIAITYGYSKDHRPDLKQAVLALMVAQDGGVPLMSQSWDGNASDTVVFKARCEALLTQFAASETPRYVIADAKLYTAANAPNLARLPFMTRIPETFAVTRQVIEQAWAWGEWQPLDETVKYQRVELCHYGMAQRWLVVSSQDAWQRAEQTLAKAQAKESAQVQQQLFHLQAQRFPSESEARVALEAIAQRWRSHQLAQVSLTPHRQYARQGRPTKQTPGKAIQWQIHASVRPDLATLARQQQRKACFVLGTTIPVTALTDAEVVAAYKGQSAVERGFRFLKDPVFFVSSLFVKKPSRLQGLLMVMTLALLVYSVAQRRMRHQLAQQHDTLPNQIGQPGSRPTLRWVFQLLEGINRVTISVQGHVTIVMEGLTTLRRKILQLFGQKVCQIYQISPG
ncbi:MAG TPA: IS1634 family transposase [Candidatus Saccharimonadia bacterium]|nr:IS1634 family transposase [Candidatus Saccharimonadia bacterium]